MVDPTKHFVPEGVLNLVPGGAKYTVLTTPSAPNAQKVPLEGPLSGINKGRTHIFLTFPISKI